MAKYDGWTLGETEAILNVIGGVDVARAVLRGECKLTVGQVVVPQPPTQTDLVGNVVKTLVIKPFKTKSISDTVKQGKYDGVDGDIVSLFADDGHSLDKEVRIELVQFSRDLKSSQEVLDWGKANGKKPMLPVHTYGIGIQHPAVQRDNLVVALGSVRAGRVLCLYGSSDWRRLYRDSFAGAWGRYCLFGFVCEELPANT